MDTGNINLNLVKELKLDFHRKDKPKKNDKNNVAFLYNSMYNVADSIAKYEAKAQLYQELIRKISTTKSEGDISSSEEDVQKSVSQVVLEFIDKRREKHIQRMIDLVEFASKIPASS